VIREEHNELNAMYSKAIEEYYNGKKKKKKEECT